MKGGIWQILPSPSASDDHQRESGVPVEALDRDQRVRGDAEFDVYEDCEADQSEDEDERNVGSTPADDGCFVERIVDQDETDDTSESAGQVEFDPPLGFGASVEG